MVPNESMHKTNIEINAKLSLFFKMTVHHTHLTSKQTKINEKNGRQIELTVEAISISGIIEKKTS